MRTTSRILLASTFVMFVIISAYVAAQTIPHPATTGVVPQAQSNKAAQNHSAVESNPACQRIIGECKKLGFIPGQWKKDNGLWKDCFDPVVKGSGTPTRDGKSISVPVSPSDVQSCRAADSQHK